MAMCTMFSESYEEIFRNLDKDLILLNKFYSAHRRENDLELLEAHSELCSTYFLSIINRLDLEPILDELINNLFGEERLSEVKKIILYAIYYHDIGKINPNFQQIKVKGKKGSANTDHSFFSERVLNSYLLEKFSDCQDIIFITGTIIKKHHGKLNDFTTKDYSECYEEKEILKQIFHETIVEDKIITENDKKYFFKEEFDWYKMFIFVKLLYSLLVLSDSYSTIHYTYSMDKLYPLNTFDRNIKEKMIKSYFKIPYNIKIDKVEPGEITQCNNINELRKEILIECTGRMKELLKRDNRIFMLSVPTGGGKTNISMKLALDILDHDKTIKRLFYVFPYINIIEQNYETIIKTLFDKVLFPSTIGLISDIYSRAFINKMEDIPSEEIVSHLKKMMIIRDDIFLNNTVNVITNVNFFNGIIKNGGNNRYKITNFCNSIVIIDEIQTLSDKNLRVFYNFIKETSRNLNIYYIIMSATLPDFNDFIDDVKVPQILKNPGKYFNHNIFQRNEVIFRKDIKDVDGIKELLISEIELRYQTGDVKILVTLNLVDTSRKVYEELKSDENFKSFTFYLINSTISSLRRKKIIDEIKDKNKCSRILIVSTQSVEAGVDIDCDFGIRDFSTLDSIEQISGRINRECDPEKRNISKLFVIRYKDGKIPDCKKIYGSLERYKILTAEFDQDELEEILRLKKFNKYYSTLSKKIKEIAKDSYGFIHHEIRDLHYQTINNELDLIDNKTEKIDIFVCERIPLENLSKYDQEKIVALLEDPEIKLFEKDSRILTDGEVVTNNIYTVWKEIMTSTNKFQDIYLRRKITSLFNQFIITITNVKNEAYSQDLLGYLESECFVEIDEKFSVIISKPKFSEYYTFIDGLRSDKLKEVIKSPLIGTII